jgi:hypothetical protein
MTRSKSSTVSATKPHQRGDQGTPIDLAPGIRAYDVERITRSTAAALHDPVLPPAPATPRASLLGSQEVSADHSACAPLSRLICRSGSCCRSRWSRPSSSNPTPAAEPRLNDPKRRLNGEHPSRRSYSWLTARLLRAVSQTNGYGSSRRVGNCETETSLHKV